MGSSTQLWPKNSEYLTVLFVYIWILDCVTISQASPEQVAKSSTSQRLLSSFGESELAKENLELCPRPGTERSGETYTLVRRSV